MRNNPNRIREYDDYAILIVEKRDHTIFEIIIDKDDIDKVSQYRWRNNGANYFKTPKGLYLHRFLMDCNDTDLRVDHIDGNPLNCSKSNLRICTEQQNRMNNKRQSNNTSGHSGITYRKDTSKWSASIQVNYRVIRLGCFSTLEEAIEARRQAEIEYFGEYRRVD